MENENKVILGIAFLFTVITGFFSLLSKISIIFTNVNLKMGLTQFGWKYSLWIVFIAGIIIVLYRLNKKSNQSIYEMIGNRTIRTATGVLVIIDGLIAFANSLPIRFMSIKSMIETSKYISLRIDGLYEKNIIENVIFLVVLLIQIIFGILILRYHKTHKDDSQNNEN